MNVGNMANFYSFSGIARSKKKKVWLLLTYVIIFLSLVRTIRRSIVKKNPIFLDLDKGYEVKVIFSCKCNDL